MENLTKNDAQKMDFILSLGIDCDTVDFTEDLNNEIHLFNKLECLGYLKLISNDFYIVTNKGIEFYKNGGFKKIYNDQSFKYDITQDKGVLIYRHIREVKIYKWISIVALIISISSIIILIFKIF